MAVELEHIKKFVESMKAYKKLKIYITSHFGNNHNLLKIVEKAII